MMTVRVTMLMPMATMMMVAMVKTRAAIVILIMMIFDDFIGGKRAGDEGG